MAYVLGLLSPIPVVKNGEVLQTLDLWVRDLQVQVTHTSRLKLFCPLVKTPSANWSAMASLPKGIELVPIDGLRESRISSAIADCDIVQVGGGDGWYDARLARQFVRKARLLGIKCIVGISSNRARAVLLNASSSGVLRRLKSFVKYASIRCSQRQLTSSSDGTFIVGEGLKYLVSPRCKSLHVSTASWVRQSDLEAASSRALQCSDFPVRRLCIAARLERMKGVHLGIEALSKLVSRYPHSDFELTILGNGPEREALLEQVKLANLSALVRFGGTRSYPKDFLEELRQHGLVLLTNLSDEQPRLIFDAISQGCIPVSPDAPAYQSLGLPREVLYRRGDSDSIVRTIEQLKDNQDLPALLSKLLLVGKRFTLEAMHSQRAYWIEADVLGRSV